MSLKSSTVESYANDASEVLMGSREEFVCESYIFEPAPEEQSLGHLYIVGEVKSFEGLGPELLEMVVQALQREYYRDPKRNMLSGFESALHQANLVLHDTSERGWREWMSHFHVSVAAVAGEWMHVSAAGAAGIYIVRSGQMVEITEGLTDPNISQPLRTFGQVASGQISVYDTLYLGTAALTQVYRPQDLLRFAEEGSAAAISTKMRQLYEDQAANLPLSAITVAILPKHKAAARAPISAEPEPEGSSHRQRGTAAPLHPRQPIQLKQPVWQVVLTLVVRGLVVGGHWLATKAAPQAGKALRQAGHSSKSVWTRIRHKEPAKPETVFEPAPAVTAAASKKDVIKSWLTTPVRLVLLGLARLYSLPRTSKIFGVAAIILAGALAGSIFMLRDKKAEDADIKRASEILYQAQTQYDAAETALIYDNREQASKLLTDAESSLNEVRGIGAYEAETVELARHIADIQDRLQKVTRSASLDTKMVGDFGSVLGNERLTGIEFINGAVYTFSPKDNTIVRISPNSEPDVVSRNTPGIGYIQETTVQEADKTIIYLTDAPGMAMLDTKDGKFSAQSITFPSSEPAVKTMAAYGNRLYVYDANAKNIFSYSKTLSGYSGGVAWIEDAKFAVNNIVSMSIDGSIYTLHTDGSVRELFKGKAVADFTVEAVSPPLAGADKIFTREDSNYLYIFDRIKKRVVVFSKKGQLKQQIFLESLGDVRDVAVAPDEAALYVLAGTQVFQVPIQPTPTTQP